MDYTCIFAALLFVMSNICDITITYKFLKHHKSHEHEHDESGWKSLQPEHLMEEWENRRSLRGWKAGAAIFNALAWFTLSACILQVAWIQSRGGKRSIGMHAFLAGLSLCGAFVELMAKLMELGLEGVALFLEGNFNLQQWTDTDSDDFIGYRTLEVCYMMTKGVLLWVDAFEWFALFLIMVLIFVSVRSMSEPPFGKGWSILGLVIGVLALADMVAELLRLKDWRTFQQFVLFISIVNTLLFLPLWLILLGRQLPQAAPHYKEEEDDFVGGSHVSSIETTNMS